MADDVVFTFQRTLHQNVGAQRRGFVQEVESVEKVDDPEKAKVMLKEAGYTPEDISFVIDA